MWIYPVSTKVKSNRKNQVKKRRIYAKVKLACVVSAGGGGTPIHYLYGYVPPNGGRDFEAPDLERGIHLRGVF